MGLKIILKCQEVSPIIYRTGLLVSLACSRIFGIGLPFRDDF